MEQTKITVRQGVIFNRYNVYLENGPRQAMLERNLSRDQALREAVRHARLLKIEAIVPREYE